MVRTRTPQQKSELKAIAETEQTWLGRVIRQADLAGDRMDTETQSTFKRVASGQHAVAGVKCWCGKTHRVTSDKVEG